MLPDVGNAARPYDDAVMSTPRSICVFCGSSTRVASTYLQLARDLGTHLAQAGHTLVWGGGSVGLMGALATSVQQQGGRVVGVIPAFMADTEVAYRHADELIVTPDMRQRKTIMEQRADAFIVLPGGIGTLEEMFEILTLRLLKQHTKPLLLINHAGFYDNLLNFMEHLYHERFAREHSRAHYQVVPDPAAAVRALAAPPAPVCG